MRVGLFDSGIGGINVLNELIKKFPNNHYIYFGDTKNLPYGEKSIDELSKLSANIVDFLLTKQVDIIIIACGTVSSNCYHFLKNRYNIPIYDIISPTIKYLKECKYHNIGIIGTTKTIESKVFFVENKNIIMKKTPQLVPLIEQNIQSNREQILKEELKGLENSDILVLGCTHYPLLKDEIKKYLDVSFLDMGVCLTNEIKISSDSKMQIDLYFSKLTNELNKNVEKLLQPMKYNIQQIDITNLK